jgi:protein-S-isoprenylcysteine O-methyltransferase Ste14
MRRKGIKAMKFGSTDRKDFLIPPFALFYFYIVFAAAFNLPTVSREELVRSGIVSWVGVLTCTAGLVLFLLSLISFGKSFRIGIDQDHPDKLVTTGVFAFSRNPVYVALDLSCWANSWCTQIGFSCSIWLLPSGYSTARYCAKKNT